MHGRSCFVGRDTDRPVHVIEAGNGPPVVFLQGGGGVAAYWASLLSHLQRDHRCLAVDRPGHGLSYRIDYDRVDDYRADAVSFVGRTLDLLELDRATLVANSMGGFFASAFTCAHPERVERLVLIGAPAGIDRRIPLPLRLLGVRGLGPLLWKTAAKPDTRGLLRLHRDLLMVDETKLSREFVECGVASFQVPGASDAWLGLLRKFLVLGGLDERWYIRDDIETIPVPTQFVWGDRDAFTSPVVGRETAAKMRDARFVEIRNAGHLPWLDEPAACARPITEFLSARRN